MKTTLKTSKESVGYCRIIAVTTTVKHIQCYLFCLKVVQYGVV